MSELQVPEIPEHLLTPPNLMTAARPLLAGCVAYKLVTGQTGVTAYTAATALSDAEGFLARGIDKVFPDSGYGATAFGAEADPVADAAAVLIMAGAALFAPRVSKAGKLSVGLVLAAEATKSIWALRENAKHQARTGEKLVIPVSRTGKKSTFEKLTSLGAVTRINDLEPGPTRNMYGVIAVGTALLGAYHGEKARRTYARQLAQDKAAAS